MNFQSHRETILDLHEGVNALVGLTGAGKSVVFKALDWLFRNRPLGDEYRSWWGGDTQVEITLKDGQKVGRVRTDNDNYYYVDEKEFRAFGNGPPPQPVLDALNLSEVNFQAQADPSFLISNSSGEVARYLNRAAHLDAIDQTLTNIASVLRKEKEELNQVKGRLEQAQEKLLQYDWIPDADGKLGKLEGVQERFSLLKTELSSLEMTVREYEKVDMELAGAEKVLVLLPEANRLLNFHVRIEKQNVEWEKLAEAIDRYEKAEKELAGLVEIEGWSGLVEQSIEISYGVKEKHEKISDLRSVVHLYENAAEELCSYGQLPEIERKWVALNTLGIVVYDLRDTQMSLKEVVQGVEETMGFLGRTEGELGKLKMTFDRLMPNICPLCDGTGGKK